MESVLSSIRLASIVDKLPSYFLHKTLSDSQSLSDCSFERIAWDFGAKKSSFRHFCQEMSERYFEDSPEVRLKETIVASARLAIAFLRPWFNEWVPMNIEAAVAKTTELACIIASWPDPEDPAEMRVVIRGLITLVAEEVRRDHKVSLAGEVLELATVVDDLEGVVSALEHRLETPNNASETLPTSVVHQESFSFDNVRPPITPLRIRIPSSHSRSSSSDLSSPISPITPGSFDQDMPGFYDRIERKRLPSFTQSLTQYFHDSSSPVKHAFPLTVPTPYVSNPAPHLCTSSVATQTPPVPDNDPSLGASEPPAPPPRNNLSLTVSYALTGFFLGTFLTLCVASSQRRTVLLHLT